MKGGLLMAVARRTDSAGLSFRAALVRGGLAALLSLAFASYVQSQDLQTGQHILNAPVGEVEAVLYRSTAILTPVYDAGNTHDCREEVEADFRIDSRQRSLPGLDERRLGTLQAAISATDLTIRLTSVTGLRVGESLEVGRSGSTHNGELMRVASIDDTTNSVTVTKRFDAPGGQFVAPRAWAAGTIVDHHRRARPENLPGYMVDSGQSPTIHNFRLNWQGTDVPYVSLNLDFPGKDSQLKSWESLLLYLRLRRADSIGTMVEGVLPLAADAIVSHDQVLGDPYTVREQHLRRYLGWPENLDTNNGAEYVSIVDDTGRANQFVGGPERTFLQDMIDWVYADGGYDFGRLYSGDDRYNATELDALTDGSSTASEAVVRSYQIVADVAFLNGADTRVDTERFRIRTREAADPDGTRHTAIDLGGLSDTNAFVSQSGTVNTDSDDKDYYAFTLSVRRDIYLKLMGLSANANLYLEGAKGQVLHRALSASTADDVIIETLAAGTYYLRVDAEEDGMIAYQLRVAISQPPTFPEDTPTTYSVAEGTAAKMDIGAPVAATDPNEDDTLTYRLSGADAASFTLVPARGQLQTRAALDYETKSTYRVTIEVRDDPADTRPDATHAVTIMVTNLNELGMVTLSPDTPQEKQAVTAMVSDGDGIPGTVTWEWARATTRTGTGTPISGATANQYPPQAADVGQYLRATATYTDGTGVERTEAATTTNPVLAAPQVSLNLSSPSIAEQDRVSTVTATLDRAVSVPTQVTVTARAESPAEASDFRQSGTTLTIRANQTASEGAGVTVTAQDNAVDGPETKAVSVEGTVPTTALVTAPDAVTLTITDDDERGVTVSTDELSIREHDEGETPARGTYTVVLDSEPTATVTISVASDDAAVSVSPPSLTFTTSTWQTAQTVTVTTTPDVDAANETATITHTVRGGDYEGESAASVSVTVTDDERSSTAVTLRVNRETVRERTSPWTVTVTGELDGAPEETEAIDVPLTVTAETATGATDFTVTTLPTLTIGAGEVSGTATFQLTATADDLHERDETVRVSGSTTHATVTTVHPATLTLDDADGPPTVTVTLTEQTIEEGHGETTLTVTLGHASSEATEVTVTERPDAFTPNPNPLTIAAEERKGTLTLTATDNAEDEADRRVPVTWTATNPLGVRMMPGGASTLTLTLTDDDPPTVEGQATANGTVRVTEGNRAVDRYTAADRTGRGLTWSVSGPDAPAFTIASGVLRFTQAPNHEAAQHTYTGTVEATDAHGVTGTLDVTVTVEDAPGAVRLSSQQPQVGQALTATLSDPDQVGPVTEWRWERSIYDDFPTGSETAVVRTSTTDKATDTYTPVAADIEHYLRATVSYTDGDGTPKAVQGAVEQDMIQKVAHRGRTAEPTGRGVPGGPSPTGGGGGGGGGGGCTQDDLHGNSPAQATALALSVETAGAICPAADVDYFTVTAPSQGLLFVDTPGGVQLRGTLWQHDVVVATGPAGSGQQPDRLGARVAAGPVVVAVQGQGGATGAYSLVVRFVRGHLENPGAGAFQSGIGVISGWVCAAAEVEIQIGAVPPQRAAYGTERRDTEPVCGDTDNGFGLLFNWNLVGDGEHEVVAVVDGVELGRATVTVTTLGEEFLRDRTGTCEVEAFPTGEETRTVAWQQTSQNFVLVAGARPQGPTQAGRAGVGQLENPGPNALQSGIGVLSGWVCEGEAVELEIGHVGRQRAAYGTERLDTLAVCGDTDNGFGLLFNWNLVGDGEHEVVAFVDGAELSRATVRVTTLGEEFVRGVEGECLVEDFPDRGQTVTLAWQQTSQNFVIVDRE